MKSYIFVDEEMKAYGKVLDSRLVEMFFYDEDLGNIYRAKVINKIDSINAYFLEYKSGKEAFLKSKKNLPIGSSVIGQIVRPAANNKLPLFSVNFRLESESYILDRLPRAKKPKLRDDKKRSLEEYRSLLDLRDRLEREENFSPSPKLLFEYNTKDLYIDRNKDLELVEKSIYQDLAISEALKNLKDNKLYFEDVSIIIDELETLTVVDVNTLKAKSSQKKEIFFDQVNLKILDTLAYNLKLRNIGGMVVIDFLRGENKENLREKFKQKLDYYNLDYDLYGFSPMGLFELSIKRRGDSLSRILKNKNII